MLTSKKKLLEKCSELGITCSKSSSKEKLIELINQKEKVCTFEIPFKGQVKTVYHLADIHIRYLERHSEYKSVFERLYETLDPYGGVMVISGDIFHNRDRFVGETLILFDEFIRNVTKIMDIFVIVGNHDCFNHSDRIDTISGIISLTKYPRFHLLKTSGIYKVSNLTFGVSSLLDGMGVPEAPVDNNTKIALFHGIVSGCELDNGTSVSEGLPISSFKGYDIVLLGDVHKRQYLNPNKTIAYPGSLIQQNFKEERNHGYLKWDIETKSSEFVCIQNDFSFIDIPVNDTFKVSKVKFTKKSRIRLIINGGTSEQEIEEFLNEIGKVTEIISVKKIMKPLNGVIVGENVNVQVDIDSHEEEIIKNLVNQDDLHEVLELHKEMLLEIEPDEVFTKSLPWEVSKIEFMNIFSYGGDVLNTIELKNGITGILADNASGKTNILNTILYGLFGLPRTQNHLNKNIISRYRKKEDLFVKLTIRMIDTGEEYFIERTAKTKTRSRIKSSEEGQVDVVENLKFYTFEKILNMSTKPETEAKIKDTLSILGKEEFVLTNMMSNISYGSTMSIISMNGAQFDDIFNNIFNLSKYTNLHKNIKTKAKAMTDLLKTKEIKLDLLLTGLKSYPETSVLQTCISDLENKIEILENESESIDISISELDSKLLRLKATKVSKTKETLLEEINKLVKFIETFDGNIEELMETEENISSEYTNLRKNYSKSITSGPDPKYNIKKSVEEMEREFASEDSKRKTIEFSADITNEYINAKRYLKKVSSETSFNIDDVKKVLNNLKMDTFKSNYILPKKVKEDLVSDLDKTYIDPGLLLKYKQLVEDKEKRDEAIEFNILLDQKLNRLKKDISTRKIQDAYSIKSRLQELGNLLDYIDAVNDKTDLENELRIVQDNNEVDILLSEKEKLIGKMSELRGSSREMSSKLAVLKRDLTKVNELNVEISTLTPDVSVCKKKLNIYKMYVEVTHQKNLPKKLISNVIKGVTDDANILIYECTGLICEIQENEKWEVVVKKGNMVLGPEHCSGYERFIINTSLKISFDKYKQLASIKLFMIDETIDCVSESNLEQIDTLLECLQKHYGKVILISHNEDLKKKINGRIELLIENKVSRVI